MEHLPSDIIRELLEESHKQAHIGNGVLHVEEGIFWLSQEAHHIFGMTPDQFKGTQEAYFALIHEDDRDEVKAAFAYLLQSQKRCEVSYRIRCLGGGQKHLQMACKAQYHDQSRPALILCTIQDITKQKEQEQAHKESERMLFTLMANLPGMAYRCLLDEHWTMQFVSDGCLALTGYPVEAIIDNQVRSFASLIHPDDEARVTEEVLAAINHDLPFETQYRIHRKDGEVRWVWEQGRKVGQGSSQEIYLEGFITDITKQKQAEEYQRLSVHFFDNTSEGILITDAQAHILEVNKAFTETTGYSREEVLGKNPRFLQSGQHDASFYGELWRTLKETGQWRGEIWNRRKDGSVFPELQTISSVHNDKGIVTHYVALFSDISQLKASQEKLDYLAHHDPLTALPNRLLLLERLEQAITRNKSSCESFLLIFMDLDHFKHVNDSLGHIAGDVLLQKVAQRLSKTAGDDNLVARIGGDEFVLLLEHIEKDKLDSLPRMLFSCFERPFRIDAHEVRVTASMGLCTYPGDGDDPHTLLRNADAAMYKAKNEGRNTFQFYTKELTTQAYNRLILEHHLSQAITKGELFLTYQPQIDLHSQKVIGAEALLRWKSEALGFISPAEFIPLAEDTGLIHPIGQWVLETACLQAKQWLDQGVPFGRIAVNIAGPQIQRGGLPTLVAQTLASTGLPPERLELEVTEGFIMQHAPSAIEQLMQLRELGVVLAIDDFGTGYSSLSYLKSFPIHKLKIDKSFVENIPEDTDDVAIAKAIIALGKSLGLTIIAEGVETLEQATFLLQAGSQEAQGYYYSRPVPAEAFIEQLQKLPP